MFDVCERLGPSRYTEIKMAIPSPFGLLCFLSCVVVGVLSQAPTQPDSLAIALPPSYFNALIQDAIPSLEAYFDKSPLPTCWYVSLMLFPSPWRFVEFFVLFCIVGYVEFER